MRQLAQKIGTGHTVCPAVLNGSKAADWREQQVFMVDIDNADKNQPQLSEEQAVEICDEHGLPLATARTTRNLGLFSFWILLSLSQT